MKTIWSACVLLILIVSMLQVSSVATQEAKPYDIIVRDDKEPFIAAFQSRTGAYAIESCGEFAFGAAANAKIEKLGCITHVTFDFKWRGDRDFSFRPRTQCDKVVTIKTGDTLHGDFTIDTCAKTASGTLRDDTQNSDLMTLSDSDTSDSKDFCTSPPACK